MLKRSCELGDAGGISFLYHGVCEGDSVGSSDHDGRKRYFSFISCQFSLFDIHSVQHIIKYACEIANTALLFQPHTI